MVRIWDPLGSAREESGRSIPLSSSVSVRWKFYGRRGELGALLKTLRSRLWFFGVLRGRRRVGKTTLVLQALSMIHQETGGTPRAVLLELPDSTPDDAASELRSAIQQSQLPLGSVDSAQCRDLPGMATLIASLCRQGVIVVIDEFQVCYQGPLRGFPALLKQRVDRLQESAGGLIVMGSLQSEMEAMLHDRRAPLFGRPTFSLNLKPWGLRTVFEVCADRGIQQPSQWLTLWTLFGGVPAYWRLFSLELGLDHGVGWSNWARNLCASLFLRLGAPLQDEGEMLLGREIRGNFLRLLRTIARSGASSHRELSDSVSGISSIGPYLTSLVRDLRLVDKEVPIFASDNSRNSRYVIADPFLRAWLAAIRPSIRDSRVFTRDLALDRLLPRLSTLEGLAFERMVRLASEEASRSGTSDFPLVDLVRGYWNRARSGENQLDVDFVAWTQGYDRVRFGSCKRNALKHTSSSLARFRSQVRLFLSTKQGRRFRHSKQEFALFSPVFADDLRNALESEGWLCRDLRDFRAMLCKDRNGSAGDLQACVTLLEV